MHRRIPIWIIAGAASCLTAAGICAQDTPPSPPAAPTPPTAPTNVDEFPAEWFYGKEEQRAKHQALMGKYRPEFEVTDWINEELTDDDLVGKVVLVDLWATWCGPCIGGIPHLNDLYSEYKDEGLVVLGVCTSRNGQEKMEATAEQHGITYPVARDPGEKTAKAWSVMWYPTYGVVDRNGVLRALGVLDKKGLDEIVKTLLAEEYDEEKAAAVRKEAEDMRNKTIGDIDDGGEAAGGMVKIPDSMFERGVDDPKLNALRDKPAPALVVTEWMNTESAIDLASLKGSVVLLDYWATW
ncbi:MAG: redoxin domain-containing protein [Phycisphaerales bacterium]